MHKTQFSRSDLSPLKKVRALSQWNMAILMRFHGLAESEKDRKTDFSKFWENILRAIKKIFREPLNAPER